MIRLVGINGESIALYGAHNPEASLLQAECEAAATREEVDCSWLPHAARIFQTLSIYVKENLRLEVQAHGQGLEICHEADIGN